MEQSTLKPKLADIRTFLRIRKMVGRFLTRYVDQENLAAEIWTSLWIKSTRKGEDVYPSWKIVRCRCIDEVNRYLRKKEVSLQEMKDEPTREELVNNRSELVDRIMSCPWLTQAERGLVFDRFYAGKGLQETALETGQSKTSVKRKFREVLTKLRLWAEEAEIEEGEMW